MVLRERGGGSGGGNSSCTEQTSSLCLRLHFFQVLLDHTDEGGFRGGMVVGGVVQTGGQLEEHGRGAVQCGPARYGSYDRSSAPAALLTDHNSFPLNTLVWHLAFSHNGTMLASCGKDQTAIIWDVERTSKAAGSSGGSSTVSRRHVLRGHSGPVAFLCWSPDDTKLATCGERVLLRGGGGEHARCLLAVSEWMVGPDHCIALVPLDGSHVLFLTVAAPWPAAGQDALRLWDAASGKCLSVFLHHKDPVRWLAAWSPSSFPRKVCLWPGDIKPRGTAALLACCSTA